MKQNMRIYRDNRSGLKKQHNDNALVDTNKNASCDGEVVAEITMPSLQEIIKMVERHGDMNIL